MATRTWSGLGGDDNWTTSGNWDVLPIAGDDLVFAGSTRTSPNNNFPADTSFASITFAAAAASFTLTAGNRITLTGNITDSSSNNQAISLPIILNVATCTIDTANTITMSGIISQSGTRALTKTGTGTLTLSGANTYSGATTVSAGVLQAGAATTVFGSNSAVTIANTAGAILDLNTFSVTIGSLACAGVNGVVDTVAGGTPTLTMGGNGSSTTFAGIIKNTAGTLSIMKTGAGNLTLSGASTYGGTTTLGGGTLTLSGGNDRLPTTTSMVVGGGSTTFALGSNNQTMQQLVTTDLVTTSLTITGSGSATLSLVGAADFVWGSGGAIASVYTYTLDMSGLPNFVFNVPTNIFEVGYKAGASNNAGNTANSTVTLATNNTITASQLGIATLANANNNGGTHTLKLGVTNIVNVDAISMVRQRANAYLQFDAAASSATFRATNGTDGVSSAIIGTLADNNASRSWTAQIDLTNGTVDYLGTDMIVGRADPIGITLRLGTVSGFVLIGNGTFIITGTMTVGQISQSAGTVGAGTFAGNGTFTLNHASGVATFATLELAKNTVTDVTGTRTVSGTVNLTAGTLNVTTFQRGAQTGTATPTTTFNWTAGTIKNISGADLTWSTVPITLASGTHTFDIESGRTATINPAIGGGAFSLAKSGAGTLTLIASNTYTGTTTISAGTLLLTGSTAAGSAVTVASGGTLKGTGTVNGSLTANSGGTVGPGLTGSAIGTLNTAATTLQAGSTFKVDLSSTGPTADRLASVSTISLAGDLTVNSQTVPAASKTYTLMTATTSITGTFTGKANNSVFTANGSRYRIEYTPTTVTLTSLPRSSQGFMPFFVKQSH